MYRKKERVQVGCGMLSALCRHYSMLLIDTIHVRQDRKTPSGDHVQWALGVLPDGQSEVAGIWSAPAASIPDLQAMLVRLKGRGVERIDYVVTEHAAATEAAVQHIYPRARIVLGGHTSGTAWNRRERSFHGSAELMSRLRRAAHIRQSLMPETPERITAYVLAALEAGEQKIEAQCLRDSVHSRLRTSARARPRSAAAKGSG